MPEGKYRWIVLVLSYLCMLVFAFTLQSLPPILTLIIKEFKLTHAEAGLLMSFFALPAIFLAILAGLLSDRFGAFKTGVISLILVIIGTSILAVSGTFFYAGLGRLIAGIGAVTLSVVSSQMLSQWFRGREIGTAMGIYNTAMPVGTIVSFMTFGRLGESLSWRIPILISAIMGALGLAAFLLLYRPSPNTSHTKAFEKERKVTGPLSDFLKVGVSMWLVGSCWMWFNAAIISFSTFSPDFFVSKGYSLPLAGVLTSLLMWGSVCISPVIGRLVDKVDNNDLFIAVGGALIAGAIYLVTRSSDYLFPMVVMAVAVAFVPTPIFSFTSKIMEPQNLGLGFGILATASSTGMVFGPYLAGMVKDKTGSYETSFIFLSFLALLVTLTALALRIRIRRN